MTLNILGAEYTVTVKKYDEDETFRREDCAGYCAAETREIVVLDLSSDKDWAQESPEYIAATQKRHLRHEIVHAFYYESGLWKNSFKFDGGWAMGEEMIDWIAIQGPKIHRAWQEAGAL